MVLGKILVFPVTDLFFLCSLLRALCLLPKGTGMENILGDGVDLLGSV